MKINKIIIPLFFVLILAISLLNREAIPVAPSPQENIAVSSSTTSVHSTSTVNQNDTGSKTASVVTERPKKVSPSPSPILPPASVSANASHIDVKDVSVRNDVKVPEPAVLASKPVTPTPQATLPIVAIEPALNGIVTSGGIFAWTNVKRMLEGISPVFTRNPLLDEVARQRAVDMFAKQYFDHVSPEGTGAADLATDVGYAYVGVGENIALGGFLNDEHMVTAWMNSPHHRDNILNPKFVELGVAVIQGTYKGEKAWIGVQIFGRPLSQCQAPDPALKIAINQNNSRMDSIEANIVALNVEFEAMRRSGGFPLSTFNMKVAEYNSYVDEINALSQVTKTLIEEYNKWVAIFNACVEM